MGKPESPANAKPRVVRCPACGGVLMRFARIRDAMVADLRGVATLSYRLET